MHHLLIHHSIFLARLDFQPSALGRDPESQGIITTRDVVRARKLDQVTIEMGITLLAECLHYWSSDSVDLAGMRLILTVTTVFLVDDNAALDGEMLAIPPSKEQVGRVAMLVNSIGVPELVNGPVIRVDTAVKLLDDVLLVESLEVDLDLFTFINVLLLGSRLQLRVDLLVFSRHIDVKSSNSEVQGCGGRYR
jgi:hypothetical protein